MQELNENSFLAQSMCVSVLSSSLLFAVEFIIICSTVVSGGQHGAVLGARQTPHATRPLEAECGAGEPAPKHPFWEKTALPQLPGHASLPRLPQQPSLGVASSIMY